MKKRLLAVLLISVIVLAAGTIANAEELQLNTEEFSDVNIEDSVSISESQEETAIVSKKFELTITENYFPDENFREYLKETFDKNGDGYLESDELRNITSIDVSNKNIKSLVGIARFSGLKNLNCNNNQLTALNLAGCFALETLSCRDNQLTSLEAQLDGLQLNIINLQYLDCSNNQLTTLDVSRNENLQTLECSGNQLATLDVSKNHNLQTLTCSNNQLTALDVGQNPILKSLWCDRNQLTDLNISKNSELIQVTCENNQLKELDISNNKKLGTLRCNDNQLTSLDISNNLEMTNFDCSDNQLVNLEIAKNSKLQLLWCVRNQLSSLDVSKITDLVSLRCYNNHLRNLDLSCNKKLLIRNYDEEHPNSWHTNLCGAHVIPQDISADIVSINDTWILDLAAIVGKENLNRVTLTTKGAELSADGTVTFSGSNMPTELVYNYDTKNPAEDTPMTVHVALTQKNVDDQTGKDVTVDTGGLDIDNICKENNININANFEIVLSQDTPSKESIDKLTQAAGTNGYSISATYEILMSLFSNGQKVKDIIDNFGRIKLTFRLNASLAGQNAVVYQLHNDSQVIVHDGLTVNTDGTVTVTVDKFSAFAVAVKPSSNNTGKPDTGQSGTNKPDSNRPGTNQPDTNKPDTNQPDSNKTDTNQPNINQPDAGQPNVKQTNANQISPKTGDGVNPVFWIIVAMAASITGILSIKICYKH